MAVAFGPGIMPGHNYVSACDIVLSETGQLPHLPVLPDRGKDHSLVALTAGLSPELFLAPGPRTWVMEHRESSLSRSLRVNVERDLDVAEALWTTVDAVKFQIAGPFSLAAQLETPTGQPVLQDPGALEHLTDCLVEAATQFSATLAHRLGAQRVVVQVDEPRLDEVAAGALPGPTTFDPIRPVHSEAVRERLARFPESHLLLNLCGSPENVAAVTAPTIVDVAAMQTRSALLDVLGNRLDSASAVLALDPQRVAQDPREEAIALARLCRKLGVDQTILSGIDVTLARPPQDPGRSYAGLHELAEILTRDAGDL
ncbi:hypothetical protein [Corynebacterium tapiri]|uniref:Methionine synthase n=1 Tax=Corynebacterium tapiri TaxID=1448266 RepID=A0A5C4U6N1_9CORY|nr:hypothetical protein [Corynebacterium tapiri]TNL99762.1 hypothetical protein FHE74_01605 [Corynebacterium tapiri]